MKDLHATLGFALGLSAPTIRKAEFERVWVDAGLPLIDPTGLITGKSFQAHRVTAPITLRNLPCQSIVGISVNMRYALSSFASNPLSMPYKVDALFHEMLHVYLADHPLRDRHSCTFSH